MFALVVLWFGISVPLVFVGSYVGFKKAVKEDPVKTNKIPRQIPEQPWYLRPAFSRSQLFYATSIYVVRIVVEILLEVRFFGTLPIPLRCILLLHEARDHETSIRNSLLRLHVDRIVCVLRPHQRDRFLCLFLVQQAHR
ncbi:hypothetical protein F3Y22_tig00111758pilonHSYRG00349 [Hibiscus syriacus]|uniref:Transmembrane 9 superfamily member n=1 Tax=Hibiscus syriacus TaxID=106335 RepID=A0A6A2XFA2_HIBSY|nr:hypothetical protein F3Y22_tig00111758pilonHSYRG00349 [Hibiscus syriacus]